MEVLGYTTPSFSVMLKVILYTRIPCLSYKF